MCAHLPLSFSSRRLFPSLIPLSPLPSYPEHALREFQQPKEQKPVWWRPDFGQVYILQSIAAVVVGGTALTGGTGGTINTVIGALILGVMENGMNVVGVDAYFQQSILGLVIIISVALTFDRSKTATIK